MNKATTSDTEVFYMTKQINTDHHTSDAFFKDPKVAQTFIIVSGITICFCKAVDAFTGSHTVLKYKELEFDTNYQQPVLVPAN